MSNEFVNKELVMEAWVFLREKNHSIPNGTIDLMRDAALDKLKKEEHNSDYMAELEAIIEEGVEKEYEVQDIVLAVQRLNRRS